MKHPRQAAASTGSEIMSELRVSGHLMRLDAGLFCVVQTPTPGADPASGLPGVRLSLPPGPTGRPDGVEITGFGPGGWLSGRGDAALVRVSGGAAQILVTIYQSREARDGVPPNLQVMRLLDAQGAVPDSGVKPPVGAAAAGASPHGTKVMEVLAHIQERGDVGVMLGEWLGERGSKRWIEGFGVAPTGEIAPADIEYQAVLGPGWLSPWVEGGQFCGSRGMALPVLGLRVRLCGAAAASHQVSYAATFVDGSQVGPVGEGEPCEAESLAAMESVRIVVEPRAAVRDSARTAAARKAEPAKPPIGRQKRSVAAAAGKAASGKRVPEKARKAKR